MVEYVDFPECYTAIDPESVRALDIDEAGRPRAIEIDGFTRGCPTVIFEIEGLGVTPITIQGSQPEGGLTRWVPFRVTFNLDYKYDVCGQEITIVAQCQEDRECTQRLPLTLECEGCPNIVDPSATALGCDQLNTRFLLRAIVRGFRPPNTRVFWRFGDGSTSRSEDIELQETIVDEVVEAEHSYTPPGPYRAILEVATRPGCTGGQLIIPADQFLDCMTDMPDCPTVTVSVRPSNRNNRNACDGRRRREMILTVNTNALPIPKLVYWDFGDNNFSAPFNLLLNEQQDEPHLYDVPGRYEAALIIPECPSQRLTIDVTAQCSPPPPPVTDCPVVQFSASPENGCREPDHRNVTFRIIVQSAPTPKAAQLDFGDGSPVIDGFIVVGQNLNIEHLYTVGSSYIARLIIEGCDEQMVPIDVTTPCPGDNSTSRPQCPEGEIFDPARGMCVPNWVPVACPILFWIAVISLMLAAALAIIWGCLSPTVLPLLITSIGIFFVSIVFLAIWLWLCARFFCVVVNTLRQVLAVLSLISIIAAAIVAVLGQGPCAIGLALSWGYFGVFYTIVTEASIRVGCLIERNR